jgi:hyperosmotically inducible periplasmic protein
MKLKQISTLVIAFGMTFLFACKGGKNDATVQASVTEKLSTVPGVTAETKDGVVTLSGSVADEGTKSAAEDLAKSTEGVKSVTNNIMVSAAPAAAEPAPVISGDDALKNGVETATKDFPGVTATVNDGVITVTGEITAAKWKTLKMSLDALNPKKVDASGLKVK